MIILRIVEYSIFDEKFELEELNSLKNSILEFFGSVCSINSNFVLRLRIGQTESIFQRVFHCHPRVMFIDHDGCQNDNSLCIPLYSGIFMNPSLICC